MELVALLLFIIAVLVALDVLAPVDGSDFRDWEDPRPWWPDEEPRAA